MKTQKVKLRETNLLDLIPVQNIRSRQKEEGFYVLLKPKFTHPLLVKHLLPRLKNPYFKIKLDEIGSFIWNLCDGKNTVKDIGNLLRKRFGERIEPLHDRVGLFFQNLEKNKFITFRNL